ncbi:MAG: DUF3761 domain-containing protein [Alphaproteobacteria bacterium]|nr:DUF3761 domain-containing protein [Alphaproteobacteria bacterium]MBM3625938.1 DUF3761 domain-containing protein [Alphaproteobacteria bacterium]MBM3640889.1 DUF3761 domain-containing protein [Alphaproteobacteria bacterium]
MIAKTSHLIRHAPIVAVISLALMSSGEAKSPLSKTPLFPGTPNEEQLERHDSYVNKRGETVHAPSASVSGAQPDGATAKCSDGTYSFSHSRSGTCSRHGGVGQWLR